jgi:hypothetical protein
MGAREGRRADAEELGKLRVLRGWWWGWSIVLRWILEVVEESSRHVGLLGEDLGEDGVGVRWRWWWLGRRWRWAAMVVGVAAFGMTAFAGNSASPGCHHLKIPHRTSK